MSAESIPNFLKSRPVEAVDHVAFCRSGLTAELERTTEAIKVIDLRIDETSETLVRLQRQLAEDRDELQQLERAQRAVKRGIAELDGVQL
ncbi:hypothetical protein [Paradevosia shaoguanensis]|uniref:Uncharacterized protein n=1 Tax=Paradevosia shaoguanensis TaxID=1335043 RepID=A0AA41QSD5_9HYPH|nr:hypothetical protein [Paradevosia shaoguanensis]MCF1744646.1 hypothetical protein [Paradevosia shaoguanensis]MCI0129129.1 hypothetical protein [Paradevosia shaoguanensis]